MAKKRVRGQRLSREVLIEAARFFGRQGGKARLTRLSREKRQEVARKAAMVRWSKEKGTKGSTKT